MGPEYTSVWRLLVTCMSWASRACVRNEVQTEKKSTVGARFASRKRLFCVANCNANPDKLFPAQGVSLTKRHMEQV